MSSKNLYKYVKSLTENVFDQSLKKLPEILKANKAIIMGSSILAAINPETPFNDIDIYVNLDRAQNLYMALTDIGAIPNREANYFPEPYNPSNIIGGIYMSSANGKLLDIKIVDNNYPVISGKIARKAHISFDRIWYDGEHIWSISEQDALDAKDRIIRLSNPIPDTNTKNRIKKYENLGYEIEGRIVKIPDIEPIIIPQVLICELFVKFLIKLMHNDKIKFSPTILVLKLLNNTENNDDSGFWKYNWTSVVEIYTELYSYKISTGEIPVDINTILGIIACEPKMKSELYKFNGTVDGNTLIIKAFTGMQLQGLNRDKDSDELFVCDKVKFLNTESIINSLKFSFEDLHVLFQKNFRSLAMELMSKEKAAFIAKMEPQKEEVNEIPEEFFETNGMKLNGRCLDTDSGKEINTSTWYPEPNHILFLMGDDITCTSIDSLEKSMLNESTSLYKCTEQETEGEQLYSYPVDLNTTYILFTYRDPTDKIGRPAVGYLPQSHVRKIIQLTKNIDAIRIFIIDFVDTVPFTISKRNTIKATESPNLVSEMHCQAGSGVAIFKVRDFDMEEDMVVPPPPPLRRQRRITNTDHEPRVGGLFPDSPEPRVGGLFPDSPEPRVGGLFPDSPEPRVGGLFPDSPEEGVFLSRDIRPGIRAILEQGEDPRDYGYDSDY